VRINERGKMNPVYRMPAKNDGWPVSDDDRSMSDHHGAMSDRGSVNHRPLEMRRAVLNDDVAVARW
jgi:hypothetical protein